MALPKEQLALNQVSTGYLLRGLTGYSSGALCLLIGSFVPIPQVTPVTCEGSAVVVTCPALPKEQNLGPSTSAEVGRALSARVMARLSELEKREVNLHLKQDYRQAWITLSLLQKGRRDAFVQSSYVIYGLHPENVWPARVADAKARLGAEYFDWYDSADNLRPDVPKFSPTTAHRANEADSLTTGTVGLVPLTKGIV